MTRVQIPAGALILLGINLCLVCALLLVVFHVRSLSIGLFGWRREHVEGKLGYALARIERHGHLADVCYFKDEYSFPAGVYGSRRRMDDHAYAAQAGAAVYDAHQVVRHLYVFLYGAEHKFARMYDERILVLDCYFLGVIVCLLFCIYVRSRSNLEYPELVAQAQIHPCGLYLDVFINWLDDDLSFFYKFPDFMVW